MEVKEHYDEVRWWDAAAENKGPNPTLKPICLTRFCISHALITMGQVMPMDLMLGLNQERLCILLLIPHLTYCCERGGTF